MNRTDQFYELKNLTNDNIKPEEDDIVIKIKENSLSTDYKLTQSATDDLTKYNITDSIVNTSRSNYFKTSDTKIGLNKYIETYRSNNNKKVNYE